MTLITKPDFTYVWASGGAIVAPNDAKKQTGWVAEAPPFQYDNWLQNRQDQMLAHINQRGIAGWDALTNYEAGGVSYVQGSDGKIYKSVAASGPGGTVQNPVTDGPDTYWAEAFAGLVSPTFTGNPLAPTPAQFDNDTSLATTEFVQRALGNFSKYTVLSASRSLIASDIGSVIWTSAAGVTLTMPTPASLGIQAGGRVTLFCTENQLIIAPGGGATLQGSNGFWIGSLTVKPGQSLALVASALTTWQVLLSTADLRSNADFGASLADNGYQKLPSGLIIQWGICDGNGDTTATVVAFPIAFPSAARSIQVTPIKLSAGETIPGANSSVFNVSAAGFDYYGQRGVYWFATGY